MPPDKIAESIREAIDGLGHVKATAGILNAGVVVTRHDGSDDPPVYRIIAVEHDGTIWGREITITGYSPAVLVPNDHLTVHP